MYVPVDQTIPLDSARDLIRLQAAGQLTAVQIASASLESIQQSQASINAYTHVASEAALAQAADIDRRSGDRR